MKFLFLLFFCCTGLVSFDTSTKQADKYDYVVAQDGSGNFTTIQAAIDASKAFPYQRVRIFIKKGVYHEKILIPSCNTMLSLIGESEDSTIISYGDYFDKIAR
ncbi:MAG: hypothetical protein JSU05_14880, partial [Bacteroidetes bacterium]|nr:hypothetical protein [Bacteroidota bacterium]